MATLTVSEILTDMLDAFKQEVPALNYFASDMSAEPVKYGQTVIAHIPTIPTVQTHTAASGYNANAASARDLLTDVPIVINTWKDVPIKIQAADASQDRNKNYVKTIGNSGYALGKAVVDAALATALETNFSQQTVALSADTDYATLQTIRAAMNSKKAGKPRYGIVSSATFNALEADSRIASGDYHGQQTGANPLGRLLNLAGFNEILEYPEMPDNSENLAGFFFDSRAIAIATRLPEDSVNLANEMGIPVTIKREVITDPMSGLSIAGFGYMDTNTHYIYVTASVMFGIVAGKQAGSTGTLTDYAGHLLATAV